MNYCDEIDLSNITAEEWNNIYKHGGFKGEGSGRGSFVENNKTLIEWFEKFITKNFISSIVDIGCGDFLWMKNVIKNIEDIEVYLGLDIVPELISKNNQKFSNAKILFKNFDIVDDDIPHGFDIILVRDVFIHLENTCIKSSILKLYKSDAKFLAITSSPGLKFNRDLKKDGRYRDVNIEIEPFNLNKPFKKLSDNHALNSKKDFLNIYML